MRHTALLMLVLSACGLSFAAVITVEADGSGDYFGIQQAIDNANPGDEIVLGIGIYRGFDHWGDRGIETRGKAITLRSTDPNDPSCVAATCLDCEGSAASPRRGFWIHEGETTDTVVRGIKIINGYGYPEGGESKPSGGVVYLRGEITFRQCIFENCYADRGGVSFSEFSGGAVFEQCTFRNNSAEIGGAICIGGGTVNIKVIDCRLENNSATEDGGAIYHTWNSAPLDCRNSIFVNNAAQDGGAVYTHRTLSCFLENEFRMNKAMSRGGAFFGDTLRTDAVTTIQNNLFAGNNASAGGGIYLSMGSDNDMDVINNTFTENNEGALVCWNSVEPTVANNIIAFNIGNGIFTQGASPQIDYNCVFENEQPGNPGAYWNYGGTASPGPHDISVDPLFANPACPDPNDNNYHILSTGGYWEPKGPFGQGGWVDDFITQNSPCLDAGDPASDISREAPYNGGRINMGAYGGTPQASRTLLPGDVNNDGKVDLEDLAILSNSWMAGVVILLPM